MNEMFLVLEDVEKLAENYHRTFSSALQSRDDYDLEEVKAAEADWLYACDTAAELLESVPDPDVSMGLHLHYINGCSWHQVAGDLGIPDIEERCARYLKGCEDKDE